LVNWPQEVQLPDSGSRQDASHGDEELQMALQEPFVEHASLPGGGASQHA
jgi:hypothetical protein